MMLEWVLAGASLLVASITAWLLSRNAQRSRDLDQQERVRRRYVGRWER